jgi:hypothetical protein
VKRRQKPEAGLAEVVRLLDRATRVMQTMSMRIDVLAFGQRQAERRLYRLERQLALSKKRRGAK